MSPIFHLSQARVAVVANLLHVGVVALSQLVQIPVLVRAFDQTGYAQWLVLTAVPTALSLADFGLATAGATRATHLWARGERSGAVRLLRGYQRVITRILFVAMTSLAAAVGLGIITLPLDATASRVGRLTFLLLLIWMTFSLLSGALEGAFRMVGRFPVGVGSLILGRLGDVMFLCLTAITTESPLWTAGALAIWRMVYFCALKIVVWKKVLRDLEPPEERRGPDLRSLLTPSLGALSFPITQALTTQGLVLVASTTLSPASVVALNTTRLMAGLLRQVVLSAGYGVVPEMTRALAVGDEARAERLGRRIAALSLAGSLAATALLLGVGPELIGVLTTQEIEGRWLLAAFLGAALVDCGWLGPLVRATARNAQMKIALVALIMAPLTLVAGTLMADRFGALAYGGAFLVSSLVTLAAVRWRRL